MSKKIKFIKQSASSSTVMDGTWQVLGNPLPHACECLIIENRSTKKVTLSFDGGVNANLNLYLGEQKEIKLSDGDEIASGTTVSIIGLVGTGEIYLMGYYSE